VALKHAQAEFARTLVGGAFLSAWLVMLQAVMCYRLTPLIRTLVNRIGLTLPANIFYSNCKAVSLQAWTGPEGSRNLRLPDFVTMAQDGGKVVSLTHRPPLPPGNTNFY